MTCCDVRNFDSSPQAIRAIMVLEDSGLVRVQSEAHEINVAVADYRAR